MFKLYSANLSNKKNVNMAAVCAFILLLVTLFQVCKNNLSVNIARGKPTVLSSTYYLDTAYSSFAVDGDTSGDMETSGCAHSGLDWREQWWMVDLQMTYLIHRVIITNRNKDPERLHDIAIEIFSQNPMKCARASFGVCLTHGGELPPGQTTITCDKPIRGRFLRIRKLKRRTFSDALILCEVEVYSSEGNECNNPKYFRRTTGTRLLSENSQLSYNTSLFECADKCGVKVNCLAFNFNVNSLQCEMLSSSDFSINVERRLDWDYYGSDLC